MNPTSNTPNTAEAEVQPVITLAKFRVVYPLPLFSQAVYICKSKTPCGSARLSFTQDGEPCCVQFRLNGSTIAEYYPYSNDLKPGPFQPIPSAEEAAFYRSSAAAFVAALPATPAAEAAETLPWLLFYRDGKTIGEIAEVMGLDAYDKRVQAPLRAFRRLMDRDEAAEAAPEAVSPWVCVDERLPKHGEMVLAFNPDGYRHPEEVSDGRISLNFHCYGIWNRPGTTKWQPLPTAPQPQKGGEPATIEPGQPYECTECGLDMGPADGCKCVAALENQYDDDDEDDHPEQPQKGGEPAATCYANMIHRRRPDDGNRIRCRFFQWQGPTPADELRDIIEQDGTEGKRVKVTIEVLEPAVDMLLSKRALKALSFQQKVALCDEVGVHFALLDAVLLQPGAQQSSFTTAQFSHLMNLAAARYEVVANMLEGGEGK